MPAHPVGPGSIAPSAGWRRFGLALLGATLAACAPAPPHVGPGPDVVTAQRALERADALVRQGCYRCLEEALETYTRVARGPVESARAGREAVRTALLLARRQDELGLATPSYLDEADRLAAELGRPDDYAMLRQVIEVLPSRIPWSGDLGDLTAYRRRRALLDENLDAWLAALRAAAPGDLLSAYLAIGLECSFPIQPPPPDPETWLAVHPDTPLLLFPVATCASGARPELKGVLLAQVPRFSEVRFFMGQAALGRRRLLEAETQYLTAYADIKAWPVLTLALADVDLAMEEYDRAVEFYDLTLGFVPASREARFRKAKALTYLGRHGEAVALLDALVDANWYPGDCRYWRALNLYQLGEVDKAWDDVQAAKKLSPTDADVFKLAGIIALRRDDVPAAHHDLGYVLERRPDDCDARFYFAGVRSLERAWPESAEGYARAGACYVEDGRAIEAKIDEIGRSSLTEDRKTRLVAAKERQLATNALQQAKSTYNAAAGYFNAGDKETARALASKVVAPPDLAAAAARLLARIGGKDPFSVRR